MTRLKGMFLACCLLTSGLLSAAHVGNPENVNDAVRTEISKMLNRMRVDLNKFEPAKVKMTFMVNHKNEIVVLTTDNKQWDEVLKERLNYRKLHTENITPNKMYIIPVTIQS